MYFAQFYLDKEGTCEPCGDRQVLILDGRECLHSQYTYASEHGMRYNFASFRIRKGERFSRAHSISPLQVIKEVQHASNH
jgi:hypothetical protein